MLTDCSQKEKYRQGLFIALAATSLLYFFIGVPILLACLVFFLYSYRKIFPQLVYQGRDLYLFAGYCLLVSAFNYNTLGLLVALAYGLLIYFFSLYAQEIKPSSYRIILQVFAWGSGPLALLAIYDYLNYALGHGYDIFYVFKYSALQIRAEATFFNANYYGLYCIFAILILVYLIQQRIGKSFWLGILLGLNGIGIILTASRWVYPSLIVALAWLLFWLDKRWARVFGGLAFLGLVALIINPDLMPRAETLAYSFEDRFQLWSVGWEIFKSQPLFGRGPMAYMSFYHLYTDEADMHAHSLYVNLLANYGLVGVTYLTFLGRRVLYRLYQLWSLGQRQLWALLTAFILTVFFHGIFDVAIFWIQTGMVFLFVLVAPLARNKPQDRGG